MTMWLAALALVAQSSQVPAVTPAAIASEDDRAVVDTTVQAALVADVLPRRDVAELRPRVGVEVAAAPAAWASIKIDARVEGLLADRGGRVTDLRGEIRDAWIEVTHGALDVRTGYGRIAWGRLDEIAPTDVINPIDASRFLFEGRTEARLPTGFVRSRWRGSERLAFEGVLVPVFRRGVFDRLDEPTSPFDLLNDRILDAPFSVSRVSREPALSWKNVSGGGRVDATLGRVDVGAAAFRGFDALGPVTLEVAPGASAAATTATLVEQHPRFTMVGGDFETVTGSWAWRGEVALFTERSLTLMPDVRPIQGRALDVGVGFDRRVGEFRLFAASILHREWSAEEPAVNRTDVSVVGSIERSFNRARYFARAFTVVNPDDRSAFVRALVAWKPDDRWSVDLSAGAFAGTSDDAIGRFRTRDFLLVSLRTWLW